jgi:hypothetical protein
MNVAVVSEVVSCESQDNIYIHQINVAAIPSHRSQLTHSGCHVVILFLSTVQINTSGSQS